MKPKYRSKKVFWDKVNNRIIQPIKGNSPSVEIFDSKLEFSVWIELCRMYGSKRVIRQFPIRIITPGKSFPRGKFWKVDFAVLNRRSDYCLFIEAKGIMLPEFQSTLGCLEKVNDFVFSRLYLVFGRKPPKSNRVLKSLLDSDFSHRILTLSQLKKLERL